MNLKDMLDNMDNMEEATPSNQALRFAKATGQNAQVSQRSHDNISKRTDVASKNVAKQLELIDFMTSEFSGATQFASLVDKAKKEMMGEPVTDPEQLASSEYAEEVELDEFAPNEEPEVEVQEPSEEEVRAYAVEVGMPVTTDDQMQLVKDLLMKSQQDAQDQAGAEEGPASDEVAPSNGTTGGIPINVLSNVMGNDKDVPLIRQTLRQIQNERGINKRFMPALQIFLKPYIDILSSGFAGLNQLMNIQKSVMGGQVEGIEELKQLAGLQEAMSDVYGEANADKLDGSVSFSQEKNNDKGSVSIDASADTMDDLHDILKLAGVDVGVDLPKSEEPEDHEDHEEPEAHDDHKEPEVHDEPEAPCDSDEPEDEKVMVISPQDANYSTDKEVLVNYLKDKLKKSIS